MSAKSQVVKKLRFHVMRKHSRIDVSRAWVDYFGRSFSYMQACEEAEKLSGQYGHRYIFKVMHEKLLKKEA